MCTVVGWSPPPNILYDTHIKLSKKVLIQLGQFVFFFIIFDFSFLIRLQILSQSRANYAVG